MDYVVGDKYLWIPINHQDKSEIVTVAELRSRGKAILSNGWCVDSDGINTGTRFIPGGHIENISTICK